jgi:surface antigen
MRYIIILLAALPLSGCVTWLPGVQEASKECATYADGGKEKQQQRQAREAGAYLLLGPILGGLGGQSLEEHKAWQAAHAECMTAHGFPPGTRLHTGGW